MTEMNLETQPRAKLVERLAELVGGAAGAHLVYGEPVERQGITIIPVARVRYGFGGGTGRKPHAGARADEEGEGGGGGVQAMPVGFLILRDGEATYRPIRDPARLTGLALAIGAGLWLAFRALSRVRR